MHFGQLLHWFSTCNFRPIRRPQKVDTWSVFVTRPVQREKGRQQKVLTASQCKLTAARTITATEVSLETALTENKSPQQWWPLLSQCLSFFITCSLQCNYTCFLLFFFCCICYIINFYNSTHCHDQIWSKVFVYLKYFFQFTWRN